MAGGPVVELTDDNFEKEVIQSTTPVVVDFWAEWCMPCRMIAPLVEQLAKQYEGRVKVGKVDTEAAREVAVKYHITAIPTIMVFNNGQVQGQVVGARGSVQDLAKELNLEQLA